MIVACHQCSARLQIADEKVPAHDFALRCPKCQSVVSVNVNGSTLDASLAGLHGISGSAPKPPPLPAPPSTVAEKSAPPPATMTENHAAPPVAPAANPQTDALQQLLSLLQSGLTGGAAPNNAPLPTTARRVLISVTPAHRATLGQLFTKSGYQIFIAEDYRQALAHLREEHQHVVITETNFAPEDNGYQGLFQAVQALRPPQRRRTVFVKVAPEARTSDQHSAFLQSVNLLINTADIAQLPVALERNLRHHNELYRDFWHTLNLPPL